MIKRIAIWVGVLVCIYLGFVVILLPLVEHTLGLGVYDKRTGAYRK